MKLKILKAQTIVEYILIFVVLVVGILIVFGGFNPEKIGIINLFNQAVDEAIVEIQK